LSRRRLRWAEYRRLARQRDAQAARPRPSDSLQTLCLDWLQAREQELQPNTLYNYRWLLSLVYPYLGAVRASRLSARMTELAYRDLEAAGYSRTTLRTAEHGPDQGVRRADGTDVGRV
jgi:hypothetical protein